MYTQINIISFSSISKNYCITRALSSKTFVCREFPESLLYHVDYFSQKAMIAVKQRISATPTINGCFTVKNKTNHSYLNLFFPHSVAGNDRCSTMDLGKSDDENPASCARSFRASFF